MENLIESMKDVFALATNAVSFVNEIIELTINENANSGNNGQLANSGNNGQLANSGDNGQLANSGNNGQLANSGYYGQLANSGYNGKLANSGYYGQLANSGDYGQLANSGYNGQLANSGGYGQLANSGNNGQLANSGDYGKLANSGNNGQLANSGYNGKLANSGNNGQLANSGYNGKLANSGYNGKLANSGDNGQLANSGDYGKIESTGEKCVIVSCGLFDIVKAKKGSWITLSEYRKNDNNKYEIYHVQTEFVDGERIKEDIFYTIYDKQFREYIEIDNIKSAIISKKKNVYKVVNFGEFIESYIVCVDGVYSHGKTIKEAKESLIYKISDRDTSKYNDWKLDDVKTKVELIQCYRAITGACGSGTRYFCEQNELPEKCTIAQMIEITKNKYGNDKVKKFFNK